MKHHEYCEITCGRCTGATIGFQWNTADADAAEDDNNHNDSYNNENESHETNSDDNGYDKYDSAETDTIDDSLTPQEENQRLKIIFSKLRKAIDAIDDQNSKQS